MKLEDLAKARAAAERMNKASEMLALIDQGPLRLLVGQHAHQAEIVLTQAGKTYLETLARKTLEAERQAAAQALRALGVNLGDDPGDGSPDPETPAPAAVRPTTASRLAANRMVPSQPSVGTE